MSKMKELAAEVEEVEDNVGNVVVPKAELTHNAASICHLPGEGWSFVTIKYNPVTGEAGDVKKSHTGEGLAYIKERFKIDVANTKELSGLDIFNNSGNKY